jgi:hypothetical protein
MRFEVVVPTGWRTHRLEPFCRSLLSQTLLPEMITFLLYPAYDADEIQHLLYVLNKYLWPLHDRCRVVHHLNSDFEPWRGVAYDRSFLLDSTSSPYVYMIDDDNTFDPSFFAETLLTYTQIKSTIWRTFMLYPTVMLRNSDHIQSQGILWLRSPLLPFFVFNQIKEDWWKQVVCMWWNSWFGPRDLFSRIRHDVRLWWSYEDVMMSLSLTQQWIPWIVSGALRIHHQESPKTRLEAIFLGSPWAAYARARNRIFFAREYYRTWRLRFWYFIVGMPVQTLYFLVVIILWSNKKTATMAAVLRWTLHGVRRYAPSMSESWYFW